MIRLHYLLLILLFSEFQTELVSANQRTQDVSAIIKSYADAFTTVRPEETQYVTTEIYPKIEAQDRGFVYDFTKAKHDNRPLLSNMPLVADGSNPESSSVNDYSSSESVEKSNESEEPKGPADHVIPFSEHENPKEPSTRPNYTAPGDWAKPPVDKNIPLNFVPTKFYAQVRGSHTVKHVPQEDAVKSAETSEEKENAARLKEVVKESKANTVYTEEGYEDAAYDHAGQIRDADFHEDYNKKLNEELNRKRAYSGKKKRPKTYKKYKPRKYRDNYRDNFVENYKSQSELAEEARTSKHQVDPKYLKILKNALNQPVIDPKIAVESGIVELEKDLKDESYEVQRTSTDPYVYITTTVPTTYKPPATESVFQNKIDLETTTMRRNIFTIRPKKSFVTIRPKPYYNKLKKPLKAFSVSKNNDNYNAYSTSSYSVEPTTVDYGNLVWGYLVQNQNATPAITYPASYFEQQTVNPVIANPLAVATVNGHGPYLVVVTAPPDTFSPSPLESHNLESTTWYGAVDENNATKPIVADSYGHRNPFISVNRKVNNVNYKSDPHAISKNADASSSVLYRREAINSRERNPKLKKLKPQPLAEGNPNHIERPTDNYREYYTAMQPPEIFNVTSTYSHYKRKPYANVYDQWPKTDESGKLEESDESDGIERPPIEPKAQKRASPITKLLPPAPLSISEYATFHRQSKGIKQMPPTVMAIMPIIDAIHKHEHEQTSFPFLFRRKRSTFGFFRTPNFKSRYRTHDVDNENLSQNSNYPNKTNNTKNPANFHHLLNESPQVATKVVDDEIKGRFGNKSSSQSSEKLGKITSGKNLKVSLSSKENVKEGEAVEVEVPELDFSSVLKKDEVEPTIAKPLINTKKYPFYEDSSVLRNTALKYIVNPKEIPKKTLGGMEFYDSRIRECGEVDPNLEKIIPEDEEIANKRGPQKKKLRLHGLGDKIDCYKAKYFDDNPLDNPLFIEKDVEMPSPPIELNPKKFASRILELPTEKDDYTISRGPKNPEFVNVRGVNSRRPLRQHTSEQNIKYHLIPKFKKSNLVSANQQRYRYPTKYPTSIEDKIRPHESRSKVKIKSSNSKVVPRYQRLVYEDVMGNIMNLDKFQKSRLPKRGISPLYSKHYKRDNNREQGIPGSKKSKTATIDGLLPPPQKISNKLIYTNSNLKYDKNRYNSSEILTKNLRIYKRSIPLNDNKSLSSSEVDDNVNKNEKSTFRIVFTTSKTLPKQTSSEKKTLNPEKVNEFVAKNTSYSASDNPRHSNRSEADPGHYGKFSTHENGNSQTRRKEPKYNVAKKSKLPDKTLKTSRNTTFTSSTFVPVMVNLYDNFTARIPRGSINNQAKQQIAEKPVYNKPTGKSKVLDDNIDQSIEEKKEEEDPKKQFVVFDPMQDKNKNNPNGIMEEHKELLEFLKGNPPGYEEAFTEEVDPESIEDKSKESFNEEDEISNVKESLKNEGIQIDTLEPKESPKNEGSEDDISELKTEDPELDEERKETYEEESAADDTSEQTKENLHADGDGEKGPNDDRKDDEPFVRFSSRPHSPPENYEDERYADLGPRINKPYFYHPPFDVPAYEKYALGKSVDHSGDDYGHEETEDHEKYAFPWEHDDEDDEKIEESEHLSELDHYEYPWEKRERRERERQKREKINKKNNKKNYGYSNNDNDDYGKEASSTKFIYIPSKNIHLRGKKDVNAAQGNSQNYSSKFSTKYKSAKIKDPEKDDESSDDIEKSILEYSENIQRSTPKDDNVYTLRKLIKDIVNKNLTFDTLNKNNDMLVMNNNTQKSLIISSSPKLGRVTSTTASSVSRNRGRFRSININNSKHNDSQTTPSDITNLRKVQPTLSSKLNRQRGRNRSSTTILTTSTTTKPNIRRTRLTSTSTITRTTPRSVNERRRRPFRIISYTDSSAGSTTPSTIPTSTGRTVEREHRSRVSKEMIITKTVEDNDDDEPDEDSNKNTSSQGNTKSASKVAEIRRSKVRHRLQTKNIPDDENPSKKEIVEKVTITMEETPDHVYKTKEIDKDGVKGKFITITANNHSDKAVPTKSSRDHAAGVDDAEVEEMQRRMEAFKSFDSVIQDTEDLTDEPSSLRAAEKYVVGSLLQKLPLPSSRKLTGEKEDDTAKNNKNKNEDEDEDQEEDDYDVDDDDEEVEDSDEENTDDEESSDKKSEGETYRNNNTNSTDENPPVIKNPDNRKYYYVETR